MTDQGSGSGDRGFGGEDASRAREHVRAAEENRDALAAQNDRTGSSTPGGVDMPRVGGGGGQGGMSTTGAGAQGSDDPSRAQEHVRAAEENRDALAAQNQRTASSTPGSVDMPRVDGGEGGMRATGAGSQGSEDASQAREHVRAAEENRDALADENRRVENSTPPDVSTGR